ncbi:hypothetical protein AML91_04610, partial [Paenibacillus jilunlii]
MPQDKIGVGEVFVDTIAVPLSSTELQAGFIGSRASATEGKVRVDNKIIRDKKTEPIFFKYNHLLTNWVYPRNMYI